MSPSSSWPRLIWAALRLRRGGQVHQLLAPALLGARAQDLGPRFFADRATSTSTEESTHGRNRAATWAPVAWLLLLGSTRPLVHAPALAGARAQLTEVAVLVEPGDVCRPGRTPTSREPLRLD